VLLVIKLFILRKLKNTKSHPKVLFPSLAEVIGDRGLDRYGTFPDDVTSVVPMKVKIEPLFNPVHGGRCEDKRLMLEHREAVESVDGHQIETRQRLSGQRDVFRHDVSVVNEEN